MHRMIQSTVNLYNFFWGEGGCRSFMFVDPLVIFNNPGFGIQPSQQPTTQKMRQTEVCFHLNFW